MKYFNIPSSPISNIDLVLNKEECTNSSDDYIESIKNKPITIKGISHFKKRKKKLHKRAVNKYRGDISILDYQEEFMTPRQLKLLKKHKDSHIKTKKIIQQRNSTTILLKIKRKEYLFPDKVGKYIEIPEGFDIKRKNTLIKKESQLKFHLAIKKMRAIHFCYKKLFIEKEIQRQKTVGFKYFDYSFIYKIVEDTSCCINK